MPQQCRLEYGHRYRPSGWRIAFTKHLQQRIRASTDTQSKYLSFLSHDLRNHLNHAMLHLQLLAARLAKAPEYAKSVEDIESIKRAILQTTSGMDQLLQAEQLRQESAEVNVQRVDLKHLLSEIANQSRHDAQSKGLKLDVDVPEDAQTNSDESLIDTRVAESSGERGKIQLKRHYKNHRPGQGRRQKQLAGYSVLAMRDRVLPRKI